MEQHVLTQQRSPDPDTDREWFALPCHYLWDLSDAIEG
jgi:hypothetical protein